MPSNYSLSRANPQSLPWGLSAGHRVNIALRLLQPPSAAFGTGSLAQTNTKPSLLFAFRVAILISPWFLFQLSSFQLIADALRAQKLLVVAWGGVRVMVGLSAWLVPSNPEDCASSPGSSAPAAPCLQLPALPRNGFLWAGAPRFRVLSKTPATSSSSCRRAFSQTLQKGKCSCFLGSGDTFWARQDC